MTVVPTKSVESTIQTHRRRGFPASTTEQTRCSDCDGKSGGSGGEAHARGAWGVSPQTFYLISPAEQRNSHAQRPGRGSGGEAHARGAWGCPPISSFFTGPSGAARQRCAATCAPCRPKRLHLGAESPPKLPSTPMPPNTHAPSDAVGREHPSLGAICPPTPRHPCCIALAADTWPGRPRLRLTATDALSNAEQG